MRALSTGKVRHSKDVILISGQSNAAGSVGVLASTWPARLQQPQPSVGYCRSLYDGELMVAEWDLMQPHANPFLADPTALRGCIALDVGSHALDRGWSPAIIHAARGGTSTADWINTWCDVFLPWIGGMLDQQVAPRVRGLIWYQGETDCTNDPTGASWAHATTGAAAVFTRFRSDLSQPDLPVVIIRLPRTWSGYSAQFAAVQNSVASTIGHGAIVEDAAATFVDGLHVDAASCGRIAKLAVDALAGLQ